MTAQRAEPRAGRAVEHDETVDHVFQHFGSGEIAFLRDVTDQDHRGERLLGEPCQQRRRLPHLGDAAGYAAGGFHVHDLNGIDDHHAGSMLLRQFGDGLDPCFRRNQEVVQGQGQPAGAVGDLLQGLFSADVEHGRAARDGGGDLQEQRALARARVSSDQNDGAGYETAPKHAIKLIHARRHAFQRCGFDLGQPCNCRWRAAIAGGTAARRGGGALQRELTQRVPLAAGGTLALPLGMFDAAVAADVRDLSPGHRVRIPCAQPIRTL